MLARGGGALSLPKLGPSGVLSCYQLEHGIV